MLAQSIGVLPRPAEHQMCGGWRAQVAVHGAAVIHPDGHATVSIKQTAPSALALSSTPVAHSHSSPLSSHDLSSHHQHVSPRLLNLSKVSAARSIAARPARRSAQSTELTPIRDARQDARGKCTP